MVKIFGKRGQAALEFLTTYGWAFMVILVMIGALAYFGVLSPKNLVADKCLGAPGFTCGDYLITTNSVSLNLENGQGDKIYISNVDIKKGAVSILSIASDCDLTTLSDGVSTNLASGANATVVDGDKFTIVCAGVIADTLKEGEKSKITYSFDFQTSDGAFSHPSSGTITAKVQP